MSRPPAGAGARRPVPPRRISRIEIVAGEEFVKPVLASLSRSDRRRRIEKPGRAAIGPLSLCAFSPRGRFGPCKFRQAADCRAENIKGILKIHKIGLP